MKLPTSNDILNHVKELYEGAHKSIVSVNQGIGFYAGAIWMKNVIKKQLNNTKFEEDLEPIFEHNEEIITNEIEALNKY
ncbi:MAG: hypothetical protein WC346_05875 [Methanogenium sp.]|jgi:hypothetical protein